MLDGPDDPRGALKLRAAEAKYPFVVANINDEKSGARIKWPNMPPSSIVDAAGTKVGIIGAATESTPYTTMPANFAGLKIAPTAPAIVEEAKAQAKVEGDRIIAGAKAEIDQEVFRAKEQLRTQVSAIALAGASKILGREIDAKAHNDLLDKLVAEI